MSSADRVLQVAQSLERLSTDMSRHEIVQAGVDIAQHCTGSAIAYLHFLNADQNSIELGVWSHDTLAGCTAVYDRHYPVEAAGIWADSARLRMACVHNDYEREAGRRGLPAGHSQLIRHLGLPVIDDGRVRMLIGVGNKPADYDADDVRLLEMVARRVWSVTRQREVLEHYLDLAQRLRHLQEIAAVCGLEYDVDEDLLAVDAMFAPLFRSDRFGASPACLDDLLALIDEADHEPLRRALRHSQGERQVLRLKCRRGSGELFAAELKLEFRPREIGQGLIGMGTLQDLSESLAVDDLRRRADADPLTGLANRRRLHQLLGGEAERRGASTRFAFHYLDLDDFKPVNDTLGHAAGDEVLRIVAQRLLGLVRQDDLVVRMGGDEFAIVQSGVHDSSSALALAYKVTAALAEPMVVNGHEVRIGSSIGVALGDRSTRLGEVCLAADRALYRAKAQGGRCVMVAQDDRG